MVNWDNDIVTPGDIWACPMPEPSHQELVEKKVRDTTVRIAQAEHQKPPEVNEATSHPPGGELVQAGMTAEPPVKQETTEDEAKAITAALKAKFAEFAGAAVEQAIQSWDGLNREYQKCMTDHLGRPYPDRICSPAENVPQDLKAPEDDDMLKLLHLLLCTQTFKRD